MFSKILVAYDDGDIAKKALNKAIDLAKDSSAAIYLISIYNNNNVQSWGLRGYQYPEDADKLFKPDNEDFSLAEAKYLEYFLTEPANKVSQAGIPVHCEVMGGKPNVAIVEYARNICADILVVGTHNRGPAVRFILGSVANDLIHTAPCPVMVVRE